MAAHEIMMVNNAVRNLIRENKLHQIPSIMQTGRGEGMIRMEDVTTSPTAFANLVTQLTDDPTLADPAYLESVFELGAINRLQASYGNDVRIIIVYTLEAHPITDISTYFGFVNPGRKNQDEGILYRQPTTYGERLAIVDDMLAAMSFEVPVYVDGPCNDWWEIYGYAPNNAYLIDTDGTITAKHGWFNRSPHDMESDIRELLGDEPIDGGDSGVGSFSFTMDSERIVRGNPDDVIYSYGMLKNTGDVPVTIDILRRVMRMPEGWETSLCTDICLSPHVDSTSLELAPGAEQSFTLYVYTNADATPSDTARVSILFRNAADPQQSVRQSFGAVIAPTSSVATEPNGYGRFLDLE